MLLTLSVSASLSNLLLILNITLTRKVIFRFISALTLRLAYTSSFAIIFLNVLTLCSKNYFLNFVHVFILISSIILSTNTPRMMNQSILLTHQFLHSILTMQTIFLELFYVFLIPNFYATLTFFTTRTGTGQ